MFTPTTADGLLGTDFLSQIGAKLDFDRGKIAINDTNNAPRGCNVPQIGHVVLTAFSQKAGQNTEPKQRGTERMKVQLLASRTLRQPPRKFKRGILEL